MSKSECLVVSVWKFSLLELLLCNEKAKHPQAFSDNFVLENPRLNVMREGSRNTYISSMVALVTGSQLLLLLLTN